MIIDFNHLLDDMKACLQAAGMSVLDHGVLVYKYYLDLILHLQYGTKLEFQWNLPEWVYIYKDQLLLEQLDTNVVQNYQIFHDCGKPYCLQVDEDGKRHFPGHTHKSYEVWRDLGRPDQECKLMQMDMDVHLLKSNMVEDFSQIKECSTLLLTGLSEIHANASMFGGIDSTSFKIKWKHLSKKGKAVCQKRFKNP